MTRKTAAIGVFALLALIWWKTQSPSSPKAESVEDENRLTDGPRDPEKEESLIPPHTPPRRTKIEVEKPQTRENEKDIFSKLREFEKGSRQPQKGELRKYLDHGDEDIRVAAITNMELYGDFDDLEALSQPRTNDENLYILRARAYAVGKIAGRIGADRPEAARIAVDALSEAYDREFQSNGQDRDGNLYTVINAFGFVDSADSLRFLSQILADPTQDFITRSVAARALISSRQTGRVREVFEQILERLRAEPAPSDEDSAMGLEDLQRILREYVSAKSNPAQN